MSSRAESSYSETANCAPTSLAKTRRAGRRSPRASACRRRRSSRASGCRPGRRRARRCRRAVAAGAADLLRVRLEALGQVEVVDVADVGLVDAHAEGDRRDDDVAGRRRPPLLHRDAVLGAHARRGTGAPAGPAGGEQRGDAQRRALERDVDDRRPGRALAQPVDQQLLPLARPGGRRQQRQVRPVEAGHDRVLLRRSRSRRRCRATTAGVAVAVSASTRSAPSSRARAASLR